MKSPSPVLMIGLILLLARAPVTANRMVGQELPADASAHARSASVSPADRQAAVPLMGRNGSIGSVNQPRSTTQLLSNNGFENGT